MPASSWEQTVNVSPPSLFPPPMYYYYYSFLFISLSVGTYNRRRAAKLVVKYDVLSKCVSQMMLYVGMSKYADLLQSIFDEKAKKKKGKKVSVYFTTVSYSWQNDNDDFERILKLMKQSKSLVDKKDTEESSESDSSDSEKEPESQLSKKDKRRLAKLKKKLQKKKEKGNSAKETSKDTSKEFSEVHGKDTFIFCLYVVCLDYNWLCSFSSFIFLSQEFRTLVN